MSEAREEFLEVVSFACIDSDGAADVKASADAYVKDKVKKAKLAVLEDMLKIPCSCCGRTVGWHHAGRGTPASPIGLLRERYEKGGAEEGQ